MSQGAINIDHSRSPSSGETLTLSLPSRREKEKARGNGKMSADFRNFFFHLIIYGIRNSTGGGARSWHKVRVSLAQIAYSPFAAQFSSRVSNTICYDLTSAAGGGGAGGRKSERTQIAYLHRERCNTHALGAIFSLPTRGYNVFLGTLINSIHFAQRFLITHCTEP